MARVCPLTEHLMHEVCNLEVLLLAVPRRDPLHQSHGAAVTQDRVQGVAVRQWSSVDLHAARLL